MHHFNVASGRAFPGDLCRVGEFSMSQVVDCGGFLRGGSDSYIHFGEVGKEKSSLGTLENRERAEPFASKAGHSLPGQCWGGTFAPETQGKCGELISRKSTREDKSRK